MCPSCSIRYTLGQPTYETPAEIPLAPASVRGLEAAARDFDETADEHGDVFTAVDFIDWIKPNLTFRRTKASE